MLSFLTFTSKNVSFKVKIQRVFALQTIQEIGRAVAERRHLLRLKQGYVAERAGISQECLSRFERGRTSELGSRKLLAILDVLGMQLSLQSKPSAGRTQVGIATSTQHVN